MPDGTANVVLVSADRRFILARTHSVRHCDHRSQSPTLHELVKNICLAPVIKC
jgi:hypothetical protein